MRRSTGCFPQLQPIKPPVSLGSAKPPSSPTRLTARHSAFCSFELLLRGALRGSRLSFAGISSLFKTISRSLHRFCYHCQAQESQRLRLRLTGRGQSHRLGRREDCSNQLTTSDRQKPETFIMAKCLVWDSLTCFLFKGHLTLSLLLTKY